MNIVRDIVFLNALFKILSYIKKDKITPVKKFQKELNDKIKLLKTNPQMCKKSIYFDDDKYRDLTYKGYTIIYKVTQDKILILDIFKWQDKR